MTNKRNEGEMRLTRHSNEYWRVTLDLPPLNIFGPAHIPRLEEVVSKLEFDDRVRVVVFDSAVEGFFLTHYDFLAKPEESAKFPVGRTGLQALPDMLARLSRAPVVSIGQPASAVNSPSPAICVLPAAKKRFSRSGRLERV